MAIMVKAERKIEQDGVADTDAAPADAGAGEVDAETAWTAVLARDGEQDGRFVYAVATTGVYCRPTCPSRRPRRENVAFYAAPADAERAGFRACRRCRPDRDDASATERALERARQALDAALDAPPTLEELGRMVGVSAFHLQRTFKRRFGASPRQYVEAARAERLKAGLRRGDTVSRATYEAGFGSGSRVYERADALLGMTPAAYRRGGAGQQIRYTVAPSPLGAILVAATERGVCAVTLGDDAAALEAGLRAEYPAAEMRREDAELSAWAAAVSAFAAGRSRALEVPLDLRATAFQLLVWKALREIPFGVTRSYGEVAAAIGQPSAARAVARACAGNRVALAIPCHRVVPASGEVGGYRWGTDRKRRLLAQEHTAPDAGG
ncbi:MAG: bifunctional transcriptional activator/DNA repair enzyme protein Ada [Gemmatimonadetes bacterium]|nr:bifunctional transcriptional activator/DNA repair enzyme protein Ada [Gemmatimonadota bacterium]